MMFYKTFTLLWKIAEIETTLNLFIKPVEKKQNKMLDKGVAKLKPHICK